MKSRALIVVALLAAVLSIVDASPAAAAGVGDWATLKATLEGDGDVSLTTDITAPADAQIDLGGGQDVSIDLAGHTLTIIDPPQYGAAVRVGASVTLTIDDSVGGGVLNATGGEDGAGIGGDSADPSGTIRIDGGTINATGGDHGAAIGGGWNAPAGSVTITGGTVDATGGVDAAGIGGGWNGDGGTTTIAGGIVAVTAGNDAAGIGGGNGGDGGTIDIDGGTITVERAGTGLGEYGSGIGGGRDGDGGTVTIRGGTLTAHGGQFASGIGPGPLSSNPGTLDVAGTPAPGSATAGGTGGLSTPPTITNNAAAPPGRAYLATTSSGAAPSFSIHFGWIVHFDSASGSPTPGDQFAAPTATPPTPEPTRAGYTFTGWNGPDGTWDFSDPVTSGLTLTAQWTEVAMSVGGSSTEGGTLIVDVTGLVPSSPYTVRVVGTDPAPASGGLSTLAVTGTVVASTSATSDGSGHVTVSLTLPAGSAGGASVEVRDLADALAIASTLDISAAPTQVAGPTPAQPAPTQAAPTQTENLPATGTQTGMTVVAASILLAAGAGLILAARRRAA